MPPATFQALTGRTVTALSGIPELSEDHSRSEGFAERQRHYAARKHWEALTAEHRPQGKATTT